MENLIFTIVGNGLSREFHRTFTSTTYLNCYFFESVIPWPKLNDHFGPGAGIIAQFIPEDNEVELRTNGILCCRLDNVPMDYKELYPLVVGEKIILSFGDHSFTLSLQQAPET
jgi:hypothetical protein